MFDLIPVQSGANLDEVRKLFTEYAASLSFSLCFQGLDTELRELPGPYAPPKGRLFLAVEDGHPAHSAGCIALKYLGQGVCEMKRLYVRPEFRGRRLGKTMAERIISEARAEGYELMRLDTIGALMPEAMGLYRSIGFYEIPPYYDNPVAGAAYLELKLRWKIGTAP